METVTNQGNQRIKTATDIEQSRYLLNEVGIDPKTADLWWVINTYGKTVGYTEIEWDEPEEPFLSVAYYPPEYEVAIINREQIPAWSVAALWRLLKPVNENTHTMKGLLDGGALVEFDEVTNIAFQEQHPVDALFRMICWIYKKEIK